MNKKTAILYICICMILCVLPFAGMAAYKTDTTTEKKELAKFPDVTANGELNIHFIPELGEYFTDHFAFRQELVSLDSIFQSHVFGISNIDSIVVGENDWLYYSDSVKDYLGTDTLSDRAIFNAVNNIAVMQEYIEEQDKDFIFTIAPNKNTLYGDNMPYYYKKVSDDNNLSKLEEQLKAYDINYADLKKAFTEEEETLYLKRDSHWSNRGALLAYNEILNSSSIEHDDFSNAKMVTRKDYIGDLSLMIYPSLNNPEENVYYDYPQKYTYTMDTQSVEDPLILTEAKDSNGLKLLMYRDSFGNTLLPFMATSFEKAMFSKLVPYSIGTDVMDTDADVVVVQKVERNIDELATMPPILEGRKTKLPKNKDLELREVYTNTTLSAEIAEENTQYIKITGIMDTDWIDDNTKVYIRITNEDTYKSTTYEALLCTIDSSDYGYMLYLDKDKVNYENAFIEVIGKQDTYLNVLYEDAITFDQYQEITEDEE